MSKQSLLIFILCRIWQLLELLALQFRHPLHHPDHVELWRAITAVVEVNLVFRRAHVGRRNERSSDEPSLITENVECRHGLLLSVNRQQETKTALIRGRTVWNSLDSSA